MKEISPVAAEVRTVEDGMAKLARRHKAFNKILLRGINHGKIGTLLRAAMLYNVKELGSYRGDGIKNFHDYCQKIGVANRTADRMLSYARGLVKLCASSVLVEGQTITFNENTIERDVRKLFETNEDATLEMIAAASHSERMTEAFLHAEGNDLNTTEAFELLVGHVKPLEESATGTEASARPVIIDPSMQRYMDEHGLIYSKEHGFLNADGTPLTEKQRIDMTSYEAAHSVLTSMRLSLAKGLMPFADVVKGGEAFRLYMQKGNPKFADEAKEVLRECHMVSERYKNASNCFIEGDIENAIWWLTAPANEVLESM